MSLILCWTGSEVRLFEDCDLFWPSRAAVCWLWYVGSSRSWWTAGLWTPRSMLVGDVSESHVLLLCTLPAMLYCGHDVYRYHAYFIACHAYWCPCQCQPCLFHAQYAFINSLFLYSPCTTLLYITDIYLWLLLKTYHIDAGILDVYCRYD